MENADGQTEGMEGKKDRQADGWTDGATDGQTDAGIYMCPMDISQGTKIQLRWSINKVIQM